MSTRSRHVASRSIPLLTAILLPTAALGITLLAYPSSARAEAPEAPQLTTPAAPSDCKTKTVQVPNPFFKHGQVSTYLVTWKDNSIDEAGFTAEEWRRDPSGAWILTWSRSTAANSTMLQADGKWPHYKFRVKAFNASGDSPWSAWSHQ